MPVFIELFLVITRLPAHVEINRTFRVGIITLEQIVFLVDDYITDGCIVTFGLELAKIDEAAEASRGAYQDFIVLDYLPVIFDEELNPVFPVAGDEL